MKKIKVGDRVRHISRGYEIPCETGVVRGIIKKWDNGLGGEANSGIYDPPEIVIELDAEFVTGGNNGMMSCPANHFEIA